MLSQYKNITEIKTANQAVSAARISRSKTEFLSYDFAEPVTLNTDLLNITDKHRLEFHVYAGDTWITGNHQINQVTKLPQYKDPVTNGVKKINAGIGIDITKQFQDLKIANGNFRIAVNFFRNLIGRYERQHLRIDEISPDRTEIRLRAIDAEDLEYLQEITNYINKVDQTGAQFHKTYILNFSRNQCVLFVNSVVIGEYLYVKLYEPLLAEFDVDFKCWVVEELKPAVIDTVRVSPIAIAQQFNSLAGPNWQANYSYNTSAESGLSNWTELLGSTLSTSQQIVDTYFSGSLSGMKLNIDYSDFNNFVFYSSATERIANFAYKLELIEYYTTQSLYTSTLSGSTATTNVADFTTLKNTLIGGFDGFENYLYYSTSSQLTTFNNPLEFATVPELTGSYLPPVPKSTAVKPYTLFPVKSTEFNNWYNTAMQSASFYDTYNNNILTNAIPEYIRFDTQNEDLITFTNMLGQHYDILYTYINHMTKINKREENPKLGMPNELLYSVAKQFGWNLTNGKQNQKLWEYVLGTNEAGIPLTGSNSVGDPAVSGQDTTYAIWRRIVNNLPLLLKSKGTKRSVRALLACYGIPQSFVSINEYGGPRMARKPVYEKLNFDYALDLTTNPTGTVTVDYTQPINSVELRFRTVDVVTNPTMPSNMTLFSVGGNDVTLDFQSGNKGVIQLNGVNTGVIELFNGEWLTALLRTNGSNLDLVVKKSKYGKIVSAVSASDTTSFTTNGAVTLGAVIAGSNRLKGQLQELRLWTSSLQDDAFDNHVKAPSAYNANTDAYSELLFRLPLSEKINHATTSSMSGVQPRDYGISATFAGWSMDIPYDSLEETYYFDAVSGGAGTYDDNKVRLESNTLIGTLDVKTRAEQSAYDRAPLDSNRLGVYFSPQTMIDEDIIAQLGFIELDDFIGDPKDANSTSYPALDVFAQSYWKKYSDRPNMNMYLNMFGLFDLSFFKQLEQLLPARVEKLTGIVIQPNILERNKSSILPSVSREDVTKYAQFENTAVTASGENLLLAGMVNGKVMTLSGQDDDQWQMYLTASVSEKYNGAVYSQNYLIKSGSSYITASSPYWLSEASQPVIIANAVSEFLYKSGSVSYSTGSGTIPATVGSYGTGVYGASIYYVYSNPGGAGFEGILAEVSSYLPTGLANHRYNGSKMTSPAFNVNSLDTIDGGPVVEWIATNPNQLIYQSNGNDGSFQLQ